MNFTARQETIFPNPKGISGTVHSSHIQYVLSFIVASTLSPYLSPTIHLFY